MKHDLTQRGHGYGLRPVAMADAAFIVELREASGQFLNRGACNEVEQRAWLERYFALPDDYYFVVERMSDRKTEGLVGIYDFDSAKRQAEWGRFVVRSGSRAAVEAALLVYRCGFETLGLDRMVCRTLAANEKVVAFHDSCGLTRTSARVTIEHNGERREAIEHFLEREGWPAVEKRLDPLAARLGGLAR